MDTLTDALEAINANSPDDKSRAMARGLMRGYHARWQHEPELAISIEEEFRVKIYNFRSKRMSTSRTFEVAGKVDVLCKRHDKTFVMDHKTTSDDIVDPDSTYWRQLAIEGQANLYLLAQHLQGIRVDGAIWDVIKKPGIRPKKIAKADQKAILAFHKYCGFPVSAVAENHILAFGNENNELYEHRVARLTLDEPEKYFQRRPLIRLEQEISDYAMELWELARDIIDSRRRVAELAKTCYAALPVRNCGSCMNYGRPCEYLGICSGHDTPGSAKWQRRDSVHSELSEDTTLGNSRNVLTNSRLKVFQACKRKHYYRYELGIERADQERSEALAFGSTMHSGLEVWWSHFPAHQPTGETDGNSHAAERQTVHA